MQREERRESVWMHLWVKKLGSPGNPTQAAWGRGQVQPDTHLPVARTTPLLGEGFPRTTSRSPEHLSHGPGTLA